MVIGIYIIVCMFLFLKYIVIFGSLSMLMLFFIDIIVYLFNIIMGRKNILICI